jgi:hypothetical protein
MKEILFLTALVFLPHLLAWTLYRSEWSAKRKKAIRASGTYSGKEIIQMLEVLKDDLKVVVG